MGFAENFPLFTIIGSLFSGVLCTQLGARAARRWTLGLESLLLLLNAAVLRTCAVTGRSFTYVCGEFPAPWGNGIRAGILEASLAVLFTAVLLCSVCAGWRYLKRDVDESRVHLYFAMLNLLTAALMAMVWTNDIFTGYVFLEILTLTSCGILIVREIGRTTLAAIRYMILNLLGSGLFLLGVVLLYDVTGQLLMVPMRQEIAVLAENPQAMTVLTMAVGILTVGLAIKSGLFPFHYWMPDTYGWATPASAAVLSSLVSKSYIFLLVKIYWRAIGISLVQQMPIRRLLLFLGICGIVLGSVSALRAGNINRMVAFSSAAQIGYIYAGIGIGGAAGYTAALFHILAHAVTKSQLFLSTPRLAETSGDSLLFRALTGSALRHRSAGLFFTFGALSMIGVPALAGFASKLLFAAAAVQSGSERTMMTVMASLALSSLLNALYFMRTVIRIWGRPGQESTGQASPWQVHSGQAGSAEEVREPAAAYLLPMLALTGLNIALGLWSAPVTEMIGRGLAMFV